MERTSKNWKRRKLSYLDFFYGSEYRAWKNLDTYDDRRLYCNTYEQIKEAIESLDDEPVAFVRVAMNDHIEKQEIMLDRIISNFNPV